MESRFAKKKLGKTCNEMALLVREFGERNGKTIAIRLAALSAYPCLADVPITRPERCHALHADRAGGFAVDVLHPFRIVFEPDHDPLPQTEDGGLDLKAVTAICILEITDYH